MYNVKIVFAVSLLFILFKYFDSYGLSEPRETPKYFVSDKYFGMHIHNADMAENWPYIPFGSLRLWDTYVSWPNIQKSRTAWDFHKLDKIISLASKRDIELTLPLGLSPTWASARPTEKSAYSPGWASEPKNIKDWRVYVRTVMQRYTSRISYYEIWNEPNLKRFFSGTVKDMVVLTCEAYKIAKSINPNIKIISPAATNMEDGVKWLEKFLHQGGDKCVDIIGFHFYVYAHHQPEKILILSRQVKKLMWKYKVLNKQLWNTETSWYFAHAEGGPDIRYKVHDLNESAAYLMRAFILSAGVGIKRFYWYAWNNTIMGGLIEPKSKKLKPAAKAFSVVRRWLSNNTISPCRRHVRVWSCTLQGNRNQKYLIIWTDIGSREFNLNGLRVKAVEEFINGKIVSKKHTEVDKIIISTTPQIITLDI